MPVHLLLGLLTGHRAPPITQTETTKQNERLRHPQQLSSRALLTVVQWYEQFPGRESPTRESRDKTRDNERSSATAFAPFSEKKLPSAWELHNLLTHPRHQKFPRDNRKLLPAADTSP